MIALLKQLINEWGGISPSLGVVVKSDHVELSSTHLVIGVEIDWTNQGTELISVREIQMGIYLAKRSKEPLRFYPLERFARVFTHRAIQKSPLHAFKIPPHHSHSERIRFISQEVRDIPPGTYMVDIVVKDIHEVRHVSRTEIELVAKQKYRRSEEWDEERVA